MAASFSVGDLAPDFSSTTNTGERVSLSGFRGRPVVLYFYPRDNTPACTAQACQLRDSYEAFTAAGAVVIGISSDDDTSHAAFAVKHRLPFSLISDRGGRLRELYKVPKTFLLFPGRVTYVIDAQGVIRMIFNSQLNISGHVGRALKALRELPPSQPAG